MRSDEWFDLGIDLEIGINEWRMNGLITENNVSDKLMYHLIEKNRRINASKVTITPTTIFIQHVLNFKFFFN